jgi:hypothetical protein
MEEVEVKVQVQQATRDSGRKRAKHEFELPRECGSESVTQQSFAFANRRLKAVGSSTPSTRSNCPLSLSRRATHFAKILPRALLLRSACRWTRRHRIQSFTAMAYNAASHNIPWVWPECNRRLKLTYALTVASRLAPSVASLRPLLQRPSRRCWMLQVQRLRGRAPRAQTAVSRTLARRSSRRRSVRNPRSLRSRMNS